MRGLGIGSIANRLIPTLLSHRLGTDRAINGVLHGSAYSEVSRSHRGHQRRPEGVFPSHALKEKALWAVRKCIVELIPNLDNKHDVDYEKMLALTRRVHTVSLKKDRKRSCGTITRFGHSTTAVQHVNCMQLHDEPVLGRPRLLCRLYLGTEAKLITHTC